MRERVELLAMRSQPICSDAPRASARFSQRSGLHTLFSANRNSNTTIGVFRFPWVWPGVGCIFSSRFVLFSRESDFVLVCRRTGNGRNPDSVVRDKQFARRERSRSAESCFPGNQQTGRTLRSDSCHGDSHDIGYDIRRSPCYLLDAVALRGFWKTSPATS